MQVCFGLIASSRLVYKDMLPAVLPTIAELMKHKRYIDYILTQESYS